MMDKAKRYLKVIQIKNKQRVVNKQYKEEGVTDEVFEKQLEINRLRNKHDISDSSKRINGKYVQ